MGKGEYTVAKSKKTKNLTFNFLNRIMIVQFILMLILSLYITARVSTSAKQNAKEHLSAIANERALIVTNFVDDAESKLRIFAANDRVIDALYNSTDAAAIAKAQEYTDMFAKEIPGVEGLFTAGWNTKVYTHSNTDGLGMTFRTDEALAELQGDILACGEDVYNYGIEVSPITNKKVLSIFKGVYKEDGRPLGIVGMAVYADAIMEKLSDIKAPGLENSTYTMMDVVKAAYVFDQENPDNAGNPVVLPDLTRTCDEYRNGINTDISTTYEYSLPGFGAFVGASVWMPERNWVLMMNDQRAQVYTLANAMKVFLGIFSALILAIMILFAFLNKKQEKVNLKLVTSIERMNQAKQSLNSAMFNDVLTEVGNRVKLSIALSGIDDGATNPYYFAMFNLVDFSGINTAFGSDTGDEMLIRTANVLTKAFPNGSVYRTGSDEFVVMVRSENGSPRTETMISDVDNTLRTLIVPQNIEGVGTLYPKYKVSVLKKNSAIDASVITILKEMTNARGEATVGQIDFSDLSE